MVHRGKTQLSFSSETQQSFREPTAIFLRTWQSYREHNNQQFFFEVRCPLSRDGYPKVEREVNHLQFQVQESEDGQICNHKHRDWFSNVRRFQAHERQVPSTKSQIRNISEEAILDKALKKRSSYDRTFRNNKTCKLCFADESEVSTIPGSTGKVQGRPREDLHTHYVVLMPIRRCFRHSWTRVDLHITIRQLTCKWWMVEWLIRPW